MGDYIIGGTGLCLLLLVSAIHYVPALVSGARTGIHTMRKGQR